MDILGLIVPSSKKKGSASKKATKAKKSATAQKKKAGNCEFC